MLYSKFMSVLPASKENLFHIVTKNLILYIHKPNAVDLHPLNVISSVASYRANGVAETLLSVGGE